MLNPDSWIIILAPESKIPENEPQEGIPPLPAETVAKAMESCPILKRDGLTFTAEGLDPIELSQEGVKYVCVNGPPSRCIFGVAKLTESLVGVIGAVTVVDGDFILIVEIEPGMTSDKILSRLDGGWSAMSGNPRQCP